MTTVRVTQVRSTIGQSTPPRGHAPRARSRQIGKSAEHRESPQLEGQLRHVAHLVTVTPVDGKDA